MNKNTILDFVKKHQAGKIPRAKKLCCLFEKVVVIRLIRILYFYSDERPLYLENEY
jgi:hypothetical protein